MKAIDVSAHLFKISENFSEQRIDNFLRFYLKKIPKSMIYRIIRTGKVKVNEKKVKFQYKLKLGDLLSIPVIYHTKISQFSISDPKKVMFLKDTIIYEDNCLLVLNKPSGISVHSGGNKSALNIIDGLRILYPKIKFLELVHRLDRDTSGILLVAKNRFMLRYLHEQLRLQQVYKEYLALVYGLWNMNIDKVSIPLFKKFLYTKNTHAVFVNLQYGKFAQTHFQIKEHFSNIATLLKVRPVTGRTHQIRVHAQYAKHPIIGDQIYGNYQVNIKFGKLGFLNKLFLHAFSFHFIHPNTNKKVSIYAPIDQIFKKCLYFLRKR